VDIAGDLKPQCSGDLTWRRLGTSGLLLARRRAEDRAERMCALPTCMARLPVHRTLESAQPHEQRIR
jgi:hypothetical protein